MVANKKAVVLLSGGLDSATCLAIAKSEGFECYAMSFRYGQRHQGELDRAAKQASLQGAKQHLVVNIDLGCLGDRPSPMPISMFPSTLRLNRSKRDSYYLRAGSQHGLSFLRLGLGRCPGSQGSVYRVNALDYSGYPDCRPEYIAAYEAMANLATKSGVSDSQPLRIHAPLIHWTKAQIIQQGLSLGVDYASTLSCYDPSDDGEACGQCDACLLRLRGFEQNGVTDPARYQNI